MSGIPFDDEELDPFGVSQSPDVGVALKGIEKALLRISEKQTDVPEVTALLADVTVMLGKVLAEIQQQRKNVPLQITGDSRVERDGQGRIQGMSFTFKRV